MVKERIFFLDYAKAIGIIMIMMAHVFMWSSTTHWVCDIVCSVHVPVFFVISGVLWAYTPRKESLGAFVRKRAKALLVPYVWFSLFNAIQTWSILFLNHAMNADRFKTECVELFITGNGTVWFLVTLFLSEFFFFCANKATNKHTILITTAVLGWGLSFGLNGVIVNPVWTVVSRSFSAYGLIVVGYYSKVMFELSSFKKMVISLLMFGVWLTLFIFYRYNFEFFEGKFLTPFSSIPTMISGSLAIILWMSCIKKKLPIMEYIGKNSLLYMLCHPTFIKIYIFAVVGLLPSYSHKMQGVISLVALFLVVLGSTMFGELVKRYLPFVIGKKK